MYYNRRKVWELIIDLQVLNYDGNLIDSGCLAIITALLDFKTRRHNQ